MKRIYATITFLIAAGTVLGAQQAGKDSTNIKWTMSPILNLEAGKKVMYVEDLDLADDITLGELLKMFPELVTRADEDLIQTFDLQIDDISSGSSKEILLTQLKAGEIQKIELSVNPTTSSQINGQGGVINIIPRKTEKDFHGCVLLEAASTWDINPAFKFSYAKDKLVLRGVVSAEYYQPRGKNAIYASYSPDRDQREYIDQEDDYRYGTQFAELNMVYNFDSSNRLKAWVWESWSKENHYIQNLTDSSSIAFTDNVKRTQDELSIYTGLNYNYTWARGVFETELSYKYMPSSNTKNTGRDGAAHEDYHDYNYPHSLNYLAKGKFKLIDENDMQKCNLTVGLNTSFSPKLYTFTDKYSLGQSDTEMLEVNTNSLYLSPYVEVDAKYGPIFAKGGVRYQFYQYDITMKGYDEFKKPQNKVTAFLNFGWQIVPHHHLSLILDKSLKRPDNQQVYPFLFYDPESGRYIQGNSDLKTEDIYTAALDYQYDFSSDGNTVIAGCGIRYNHDDAVIGSIEIVDQKIHGYTNNGYCDIINANLMAVYARGPFKVFFTGNLLQNWSCISENKNSNFSYNLSLTPMLSFKDEWRVSGAFEYNSPVTDFYKELGRYFYSEVRLSKGFRHWTFYMKLTDNFHRLVDDIEYTSTGSYTICSHYLHFPGFGLGASWYF